MIVHMQNHATTKCLSLHMIIIIILIKTVIPHYTLHVHVHFTMY